MIFAILLFALFAINPFLPIQEEIQNVVLPILVSLFAIHALRSKQSAMQIKHDSSITVGLTIGISLILWMFVRAPWGLYNQSFYLIVMACMLGFYFIQNDFKWANKIVFLTAFAIHAIAWFEVFGFRLYGEKSISLITSVFNQKNHFALFIVPLSMLAVLLNPGRVKMQFIGNSLWMVSATILLYFADSDAGLLALLLSVGFLLWNKWIPSIKLKALALLGVALFTAIPFLELFFDWSSVANISVTSRLAIWEASINAANHALWFGHGLGSYQMIIRDFSVVQEPLQHFVQSGLIGAAHNHYLHTLVELGVVGLILELAYHWGALILFWKWVSKSTVNWQSLMWLSIPVYVLVITAITIPSQVFLSAKLLVWAVFTLMWIYLFKVGAIKGRYFKFKNAMHIFVLLLVVVGVYMEWQRLQSMQTIRAEIVTGKVEQHRLPYILQALQIDAKNPYALWYMAVGFESIKDYTNCTAVLNELEGSSKHFFDVNKQRKKCEN